MAEVTAEMVIVGAGVAGLSLAAQLGAGGHDVLLIDKAAAPRDKVCGEGIMPLGMAMLKELGLGIAHLPGVDFDGLEYRAGRMTHRLRFAAGVTGRGLRRTALIAHLQERALAHPSVRLMQDAILAPEWEGDRVEAVRSAHSRYRGRVIVAADGVNSVLTRRTGAAPRIFGERMAVRQHFTVAADRMPPRVQVGLFGRHDVYLTPVGPGDLLATTMTDRAGYDATIGRYADFLRASSFASIFEDARPSSEVLGWHHPLFRPAAYAPGGVWLVGDASGGIDPCLGMGISMALAQARQVAGLLSAALAGEVAMPAATRQYAAWRGDLFHHFHDFGRVFRLLVTAPAGSRALVGGMKACPGLADRVLRSVAEMRPWPLSLWRTPADAPSWRPAPSWDRRAGAAWPRLDSRAGRGS